MAGIPKTASLGGIVSWLKLGTASQALKQALLDLKPSGSDGFEGLLAVVLGKLAGQPFRLAGSGSQHGKDGEAVSPAGHIAFEGKLYSGPIDKNDVLSKLTEIAGSEKIPDLWVLGATIEIKTQITGPLFKAAERNAIAILMLDWASASAIPPLAVACAAASDETFEFLKANIADGKKAAKAKKALETIRLDPSFASQAEAIRRELTFPSLGLPTAVAANRKWLSSAFSDRRRARTQFGQPLAPGAQNPFPVLPREKLATAIAQKAFAAPGKEIVTLLGDEGCGKSWIFAQSWLRSNDRPLTVVIGAADLKAVVAYGAVEPFLVARIIEQTGDIETPFKRARWQRKFEQWSDDQDRAAPKLVVFVDGLNQHPDFEWARWLDGLQQTLEALGGVLVVSTRSGYFKDRLKSPLVSLTKEIVVPEWTATELTEILRAKSIDIDKLSQQVAKTLRNPRLLGIALTLLDGKAIQSLSELSVPRLLFEQVRSSERDGHAGEPAEQFKRRLADHAKEVIERIKSQQHDDKLVFEVANDAVQQRHQLSAGLLAVTEGRFFRPLAEDAMRYELFEDGLAVALGLSIIKTLQFAERNKKNVTEALDDVLEPISSLDRTDEVVFAALQVASADDRCSKEIRKILICAFLRLQHVGTDTYPAFCLVVRNAIDASMSALAEIADSARYTPSKNWLLAALREQRTDAARWAVMSKYIDEWLRRYSLSPELSTMASRTHDTAKTVEAEMVRNRERIAASLKEMTSQETDLLQTRMFQRDGHDPAVLASDALELLSGMPLADFAESLVAWSFSQSINSPLSTPYDEFLALIRLNRKDWMDTRTKLLGTAQLFADPATSRAGRWALVKVLRATCTLEDADRAEALLNDLTKDRPDFPGWRLIEDYCSTDPCDPASLIPNNIHATAARYEAVQLNAVRSSMGMSAEDHFLDMALPGLARFSPQAAVSVHRNLADEILTRNSEPLRLALHSLEEDTAIFRPSTVERLLQKARDLSEPVVKESEESRTKWVTSQYALLLALSHMSGEEQLDRLFDLPSPGPALLKLIDTLKPASPARLEELLLAANQGTDRGRLLLMLMFARYSGTELSESVRGITRDLSASEDANVRAAALNIIAHLKDDTLIAHIASSGWTAETLHSRENHFEIWYGSEILIEAGRLGLLSVEQMLDRITPRLFGSAANVLGPEGQKGVAARINASIARCLMADIPTVPPAVEQTTEAKLPGIPPLLSLADVQEEFGAQEFFKRLSETNEEFHARQLKGWAAFNAFDAAISKEKARLIVEDVGGAAIECCVSSDRAAAIRWAEEFLTLSDRKLQRIHNVALQLAEKLSPFEPALAARLFAQLQNKRAYVSEYFGYAGVSLEAKCVWRSTASSEMDQLKKGRLDSAASDADLASEVVAALTYGSASFLENYVNDGLASAQPSLVARALMVVGFGVSSPQADTIFARFSNAKGLLGIAVKAARYAYDRNRWSQHWLELMRETSSSEDFWRFSKLFLKIVDARFELWELDVQQIGEPAKNYEHSLEAELVKRIKAWKSKREKTLFGDKVPGEVFTLLP